MCSHTQTDLWKFVEVQVNPTPHLSKKKNNDTKKWNMKGMYTSFQLKKDQVSPKYDDSKKNSINPHINQNNNFEFIDYRHACNITHQSKDLVFNYYDGSNNNFQNCNNLKSIVNGNLYLEPENNNNYVNKMSINFLIN